MGSSMRVKGDVQKDQSHLALWFPQTESREDHRGDLTVLHRLGYIERLRAFILTLVLFDTENMISQRLTFGVMASYLAHIHVTHLEFSLLFPFLPFS